MPLRGSLPSIRQPDVREAGLPLGNVAFGLPLSGYDAISVSVLQDRQEASQQEPLRQVVKRDFQLVLPDWLWDSTSLFDINALHGV